MIAEFSLTINCAPRDAALDSAQRKGILSAMTLSVLEKEVMDLPPRSRVRLAERIIESLDDFSNPKLAAAWEIEIDDRVQQIRAGAEKGIPAAEVMTQARRELNETRRLSSARRK
jgi:putative addiction module component (TIGR02574 family)